jgi:hypothetical protein
MDTTRREKQDGPGPDCDRYGGLGRHNNVWRKMDVSHLRRLLILREEMNAIEKANEVGNVE